MLGGGSSSSSSSQGNGCGGAFSSSSALPPARRHQHHHHHHHQETGSAAAAIVSASSCWSPTNPFNVLASGCGGGVGGGSVVTRPTASEQVPTETAAVALSPANFLYANYPPPPPLLLLPSSTTTSSPLVAAAAPAIQRKRPGCLCDHQDDYGDFNCHPATTTTTTTASSGIGGGGYYDDLLGHNYGECASGIQQQVIEPLDLSLPKVKVRQHWSGGSIVQVNDSTIISISGRRPALGSRGSTANNNNNNSDSTCCCGGCCADSVGCPNSSSSSSSSRLDVSVVTVPQLARPSCWSSSPSYANQQQSHRQQQQQQQQQQPFRLQIEIPFGASDDKLLPGFFRHHHRRTNNNKPIHCHNNNNNNSHHHHSSSAHPPEVCATMTEGAGGGDESDDLQRLSDSAHQLRLSGYYYGHLSWKESVQLLQNTKVGTFLVRDSSDARYLYALSLQTDKGPTSVRIHYSSSGFRLDACNTGMADHLPRFRTVLDLVDHYVAKWSQCRDKGQFWLDNSGQVHSEVVLIRPLMRDCPSLKHLCRLACNNQQRQQQPQPVPINSVANSPFRSSPSSVKIPPTIKSYLNEYPYQH